MYILNEKYISQLLNLFLRYLQSAKLSFTFVKFNFTFVIKTREKKTRGTKA